MLEFIRRVQKCDQGAKAVEYGLIAALIAVASMAAINTIGQDINTAFTKVATQLPNT